MSEWATACEDDVALAAEQRRMPDGMTRLERKRLGVALTDRGLIAADAARITGVTPRTIARWRAERRARVRDLTSEAV
jgi:transcriptional regulator with GAF, ATPase, and Fis domain